MAVLVDSTDSKKLPGSTPRWLSYPRGVLRFLLDSGPRHLWTIAFILLVAIAIWAYLDPRFELASLNLQAYFGGRLAGESILFDQLDTRNPSQAAISPGLIVDSVTWAVLTILFLLVYGYWRGPKPYRSLKSVFVFMTLICFSIGLTVSLPGISWYGKQARVEKLVDRLKPIAEELDSEWPTQDSKSPTIGPYKAYPISNPNTLILLISPSLPESDVRLTEVIRSDGGALRFLLSGSEYGDYVEWHPDKSQPSSFHNGLSGDHMLSRKTSFGDGWYLVRYNW